MARFFAVAISHAPGLSGTPDCGQRSSASTSASWASSSARPTSRTIRATPAISRADSMRKTASTARRASSEDGTAADQTWIGRPWKGRNLALLRVALLPAEFLFLRPQLGVQRVAEIGCLEHLADLHFRPAVEGRA